MNISKCPSNGSQKAQMVLSIITVLILLYLCSYVWWEVLKTKEPSSIRVQALEYGPKHQKALAVTDNRTLEGESTAPELSPFTYKPQQHVWVRQEFCTDVKRDVELLRAFVDEQGGRQYIPNEMTTLQEGCHYYESVILIPKGLSAGNYYIEQKIKYQHNLLGAETIVQVKEIPISVSTLF